MPFSPVVTNIGGTQSKSIDLAWSRMLDYSKAQQAAERENQFKLGQIGATGQEMRASQANESDLALSRQVKLNQMQSIKDAGTVNSLLPYVDKTNPQLGQSVRQSLATGENPSGILQAINLYHDMSLDPSKAAAFQAQANQANSEVTRNVSLANYTDKQAYGQALANQRTAAFNSALQDGKVPLSPPDPQVNAGGTGNIGAAKQADNNPISPSPSIQEGDLSSVLAPQNSNIYASPTQSDPQQTQTDDDNEVVSEFNSGGSTDLSQYATQ